MGAVDRGGWKFRSMLSEVVPATEPTKILIVDAYGHSREGLSASLRGGGYGVETAAGSWEAIQKAKEGHFGLAIIDVDLPPAHGVVMDGWDLARIFLAFHPGAALILVTAEWRPELRTQADGLPGASGGEADPSGGTEGPGQGVAVRGRAGRTGRRSSEAGCADMRCRGSSPAIVGRRDECDEIGRASCR